LFERPSSSIQFELTLKPRFLGRLGLFKRVLVGLPVCKQFEPAEYGGISKNSKEIGGNFHGFPALSAHLRNIAGNHKKTTFVGGMKELRLDVVGSLNTSISG
jgi:hypothetical protein